MPENKKPYAIGIEQRPMSTSKIMYDYMLTQTHVKPRDLLALFHFYAYTAIWQQTLIPKCSVSYAAKGLHMSVHTVRKAKAELVRLGLVEEVHAQVKKDGRNTIQYYVRVNYFENHELHSSKTCKSAEVASVHQMVDKCLRPSNKNALESGKRNACRGGKARPRQECGKIPILHDHTIPKLFPSKPVPEAKALPVATLLYKVLARHRNIQRKPNINQWANTLQKLHDSLTVKKKWKQVKERMQWLDESIGKQGCPEICSAETFAQKYDQIGMAMKRQDFSKPIDPDNPQEDEIDYYSPNKDNKLDPGMPCHICERTDIPVYDVFHPTEPNEMVHICKTCWKPLNRKGSCG